MRIVGSFYSGIFTLTVWAKCSEKNIFNQSVQIKENSETYNDMRHETIRIS